MKEEILIICQQYIPNELIAEFEMLELEKQLHAGIKIKKEEPKYYNFTGPEIADIVIYIKQHTTELLVGGLFVNLAYDTFKGALKLLWIGISKLAIKKLQSQDKESDKPKSISLRLMDRDRAIEIIFEGDVDVNQADKVIDKAIIFLGSKQIDEAFNNPDFISEESAKPRIRLKFNNEKQEWEPENFGKYKRWIEEIQKGGEEYFDS